MNKKKRVSSLNVVNIDLVVNAVLSGLATLKRIEMEMSWREDNIYTKKDVKRGQRHTTHTLLALTHIFTAIPCDL